MRHICLDTETTGLSHEDGDRLLQIGAVELVNLKMTGRTFRTFVNPEGREITYDSYKVHKISQQDVENAPLFQDVYDPLLSFIGDGMLIIQNKRFDLGFLQNESKRIGKTFDHDAIDTTDLASDRWPGQAVNLDALMKRLGISADAATIQRLVEEIGFDTPIKVSERSDKHDALIDCICLAQVYTGLVTAHELELHQNTQNQIRAWPFGNQNLRVVPLSREALC